MIQFYKGVFKSIDLIKFEQYDISCFHSDKYFIVDLKSDYNIEFIKFNTIKDIEVKIFFSSDSIKWVDCYDITNKNLYEFYINTNTQNKYRFIKINIDYCLIKNQLIDIYVRKYPGLMIAARSDGFGARLMPILNAMYLAEYTGFKFGFVWKKVAYDDTSLKQFEDNDLAGIYLSNEKYIFSQEFIDEYSYTDKIESNIRIDKKKTLKELTEDMVKIWGNYIDYDTTRKIFGAKIFKEYPRLWSKIKFSPRIQEIIKLSNNTAKEAFDNSFIAIHIRSGDIVYDERIRKLGVGFGKAMPVEIAMELIEKNKKENKNIVLFGDDLSELRALKQYYHVSIIEDFIQELTGIDRIIFEINFMSKAEVIYSGHSSFARVASYIGLGKEPTFY
ncbi:hypothetical protein L8U38_07530, partial [Campylobacter lari]|nr:hypothetical protein [Campylobacter lari]